MGLGQPKIEDGAVFICEDVSSLRYERGMFYLTDDLGPFSITRAMRPETFIKCVTGAYALAMEWQRERESSVVEFQRVYPANKPTS